MSLLNRLYKPSLTLLTDLYEITMAYGYWKSGMEDAEAVFHLFFRNHPFAGGYTVACGLEQVVEFLERMRFAEDDLAYLATLTGNDGKPLFDPGFIEYLRKMEFAVDVDAVPEGTVVFPFEPLIRVRGPLLAAQMLETSLLTLINFPTLIATKAARVAQAAKGDPVLEFGLRRAQGIDGALTAARAAYIGGCAATSNVLAGRLLGIPVKGTHAHSWVMAFQDEQEAFMAWAKAMPNNSIFLVDTYDSLEGVRSTIPAARWLEDNGYTFAGIRLDSGDLEYLSVEARRILDEAGFTKATIFASNDLDENLIASLKQQGAAIGVWGVGTKLVTAYDQPALGGVYKLSAYRKSGGAWEYRVKLSEQFIKISNPGILNVRRFFNKGLAAGDAIYNEHETPSTDWTIVDPLDKTRRKVFPATTRSEDLLIPVFRGGKRVWESPALQDIQMRTGEQMALFHRGHKRFANPHIYPVGLEKSLHALKERLVLKARGLDQ